jgi:hypothetical protein
VIGLGLFMISWDIDVFWFRVFIFSNILLE